MKKLRRKVRRSRLATGTPLMMSATAARAWILRLDEVDDNTPFLVQAAQAEDEPTRSFEPFLEVPVAEISAAGFACQGCRQAVEVIRKSFPYSVVRMCIYACQCGAVAVFEDERQPNRQSWRATMRLLKKTGAKLAIFNGNKELRPNFSGLN
jgi:hypothetical protein